MSAKIGDIVRCDGVIHEVIGLAPAMVVLAPVGQSPCGACGSHGHRYFVEGSLNWVNQVEPVSTTAPRCYECGDPVAEGAGERHSRAGWVHFLCIPEDPPPPDQYESREAS